MLKTFGMRSLAKLAADDEPRTGSKVMTRLGTMPDLTGGRVMTRRGTMPDLTGGRGGSKANVTTAAASLVLGAGGRRRSTARTKTSICKELLVRDPEPEQKAVRVFRQEGPPADGRVMKYSLKFNLKPYEVKPIIVEIDKAIASASGGYLQEKQLEQLLIKVFQVEDVKPQIVKNASDCAFTKGELDLDKFLTWYAAHMFTGVSASKEQESDAVIYKQAKEIGISVVECDKIKRWFEKFDKDHSGHLDYDEFTDMMRHILKVKSKDDLSNERLEKFWKEIDLDGDQSIDLTEYLRWYVKYFRSEDGNDSGLSSDAILAAYYDSLNPTLARGKSKATM